MELIYCLKCKTQTKSVDVKKVIHNNRTQLKAVCLECNSRKCKFVPRTYIVEDDSE